MIEVRCLICGKVYKRYPSERKKTCGSAECISELKRRMRLPEEGRCSGCGRHGKLVRKGRRDPPLCRTCHDKQFRQGTCKHCGKDKRIYSQGSCYACFLKFGLNKRKVVCKRCGKERPHYAKGLCSSCYHYSGRRNRTTS